MRGWGRQAGRLGEGWGRLARPQASICLARAVGGSAEIGPPAIGAAFAARWGAERL